MVTAVTFGSSFPINGRTALGGLASGLNTQALIESIVQARATPATLLQQKITKDNKISAALSQFGQLVNQLQSVVDSLRNKPGVGNASSNAFAYNIASVTANKSVAGSSYVSVTASPGAALSSYSIDTIVSRAAAGKYSTGTFVIADADTAGLVVDSAPASGQFKSGTFTIDSVNGPAVSITLDSTDTLNSIAQKFNNAQSATGMTATVLKVSDGNFKLVFSSIFSGTDYDVDLNDTVTTVSDPDGVLTQIINGTGEFTEIANTQAASDAVFNFDGNTITRSTNNINDIISGLTFNILQTTPTGEAPGEETQITVNIEPDTGTARNAIVAFINAYNEIRSFVTDQTQLNTNGTYADTAVLANNSLFRSTVSTLAAQVSAVVSGITGTNPESLADLGITLTNAPATASSPEIKSVLTVDEDVLQSALSSNFSAVRKVFEFTLTSDNTNLRVFSRTNALAVNDFTLKLNPFATQTSDTITPRTSQTTSTITVADADTAIVFDAPTASQLKSGTITLNGEDIVLVEGDTLNDVVDKFNFLAADSGVAAHLIEVAAGQFQIAFTSADATDVEAADTAGIFDNFTFATATGADASIAFGTPDSGGFGVGTVTVNGETIDIEEGDSLNDIVAKFTAVAGDSGLSVILDDLGDGQYQLVFTAAASSTPVNYSLASSSVDPSDVFGNITFTSVGTYQAVYDLGAGDITVDLDGEAVSGGTAFKLSGVAGTALEGLVLIYGSGQAVDIDVTALQGIGDKVYNDSYTVLKSGGTLQVELQSIVDRDTKLNADIEKINEQVARLRDQLLQQFGALEQALLQVNSLLQSLDAQDQARRNASG